jgi:hypothetical protein
VVFSDKRTGDKNSIIEVWGILGLGFRKYVI